MLIQDRLKPRGHVRLEVWRGGSLTLCESNNLITNIGRGRFPRIFGGDPTAKRPSQIAIGSGAGLAMPGDTAITDAFIVPFSALPTYPNTGYGVLFQATLTEEQANGLSIRELGLMDDDEALLARWVRTGGDLIKASDMRLLIFWLIQF
jgi:hypothetical protein